MREGEIGERKKWKKNESFRLESNYIVLENILKNAQF